MNRKLVFMLSVAVAIASGCSCRGCTPEPGVSDGGDGGSGGNGGDGGPDGGLRDGGPPDSGGGGGNGDGTQTGGVQQGSFDLDGGGTGNATGSGVLVGPNGTIQLNSNDVQLHFAWVANNSQGWVSKYDTVNNKEIGRYYSVLPVGGLRPGGANSPSRTAVDLNGDVWVANRAPDIQGSVTKIINDTSTCPDRNGNGKIDTSRDVNGDGVISTLRTDGEMILPTNTADINQYDECVVSTTLVGVNGPGVHARGLAVSTSFESSTGDVWVGLHAEKQVVRLDTASGQPLPANADGGMAINLAFGPYGLAVDGRRRLWVVSAPGDYSRTTLAEVDVFSRQIIPPATQTAPSSFDPSSSYGIAIDGKNRVWLGAWTGGAYAYRYDRPDDADAGTWTRFYLGDKLSQIGSHIGRTRGIAADDTGLVWIDSDKQESTNGPDGSQLIAINGDTGVVRPFTLPDGGPVPVLPDGGVPTFVDFSDGNTFTAIGVGVDVDGNIWVNNNSGNVVKTDRNTGAFVRLQRQSGSLYTYSDFTGYQLRHFTAPQGTFRYTLTGCDNNTVWTQAIWDAVTPPNTSVKVYVKVGNSLADLNSTSQTRYGPYSTSPAELQPDGGVQVPPAKYMRLEFVLASTDHMTSPELRSFRGVWYCPVILR